MNRLFYIGVIFALVSCNDNSMYFDIEMTKLKSCTNAGLRKIVIENLKTFDLYILRLDPNIENNGTLDFNNIPSSYSIEFVGDAKRHFSLRANSLYKLSNKTNGDAAYFELLILTDDQGKVVKTNRPDCHIYDDRFEYEGN